MSVESTITKFKSDAEDLEQAAYAFTSIQTKPQVEAAGQILTTISQAIKDLEAQRKSFTAPINESLTNINAAFKTAANPFHEAKTYLSGKVAAWHTAEQKRIDAVNEKIRKEEERRRKIQESHKERGHEVKEEIHLPQAPQKLNKIGGAHTRKIWVFEVEDLSQVPREFMQLDGVKVNNAIKAGTRKIKGIKIQQKTTVVS